MVDGILNKSIRLVFSIIDRVFLSMNASYSVRYDVKEQKNKKNGAKGYDKVRRVQKLASCWKGTHEWENEKTFRVCHGVFGINGFN